MASNVGQANPKYAANDYNVMAFVVSQMLAGARICMLVKVLAVTNNGGVTPIGTVNVQPLVQQVNGAGEVTPHGTIYKLPYIRVQGGTNAVILDPQVGDIGIICIADRDSSAAVAAKDQAPPGSNRRNSPADGFYMGSVISQTPVQYVQFTSTGITINSPQKVTIIAPNIEADATTQFKVVSPDIQLQGAVTATSTVHIQGAQTNDSTITASGNVTGQGTSLHTHVHSGVQSGGSNTGAPV